MRKPGFETAFVLLEATVASIYAAYASGALTCVALVEAYLARIARARWRRATTATAC